MRKLSATMKKALDELKRVYEYSQSAEFPDKDEPALIAGWRVHWDAKYPTLDALWNRGLAEFTYGKLHKDGGMGDIVPLYRLHPQPQK